MMQTWEILSLILGSNIAFRVAEHFLTRKSQKVENEKGGIENIDAATETWQKVVDKLELRIDGLLQSMKKLRDDNILLEEEVFRLREEVVVLKASQKKIERYEKQIKQLEAKVLYYEKLLHDNGIDVSGVAN